MIVDKNGSIYGTTLGGGNYGVGSVFRLTPKGSSYGETVLHSFQQGSDGARPYAGLIADKNGSLYGTTSGGGSHGAGTVFRLAPHGSGYDETILYSFPGGNNGGSPSESVIADKNGALYGTTGSGGVGLSGIVYKLTPNGSIYTERVLHAFGNFKLDGGNPASALIADQNGILYGTTQAGGGFYKRSGGSGAVFKIKP